MNDKLKFVCMGTLLIFAGMYLVGLDNNFMDYDEGAIYAYPQILVYNGLKPYIDFPYAQPPLLLYVAHNVLDTRIFSVLTFSILCVGAYFLGRKFGVGWYTVIFLASCPLIMRYTRLGVGDIPAIAFFTIVLADAIYVEKGLFSSILTGIAIAACLLIKIQMIIPIAFIFLPLIVFKSELWHIIPLSFAVMIFIVVSILMPNMLNDIIFNNVGGYDLTRAASYLVESVAQFSYFTGFILCFALYGAYISLKHMKDRKFSILFYASLSSVAVAMSYSWLAYRHFMFLLPVMAIFAGIGLKSFKKEEFAIAVILVSILIPMGEWHRSMFYDNDTRLIVTDIVNYTKPWEKIYTDQPILAALSNKTMPNTALMWNGMGRLRGYTADNIIADINNTRPSMVLLVASTPESMDKPRIVSTFGVKDADRIFKFLDDTYKIKEYTKRDYQMIRVWKK